MPKLRRTLCGLLCLCLLGTSGGAEPQLRIRLKDGSFGSGSLIGVAQANRLGWQSDVLVQPLEFDVQAIRAVTTDDSGQPGEPADAEDLAGLQAVEVNRQMLIGKLLAMDEAWLTLQSAWLGNLRLAREQIHSISAADYAGEVVYAGPLSEAEWRPLSSPSDWSFEAGALVANKQGATVVGNVQLPAKAQINLSLSWRGAPDFVLSLGTLATNRVSRIEEVPAAARLEVWANQLALVREVDKSADIAMLADLSGVNPRIDLTVYLDQEAGRVVVCDAHGRPLEKIEVPSDKANVRSAVHLSNSGPSLTIEHFEVRQWDGNVTSFGGQEASVLSVSGEQLAGAIAGYDPELQALQIVSPTGERSELPLSQLRHGDLSTPAPTAEEPAAGTSLEIVLLDRTRLAGQLSAAPDPQHLLLVAPGVEQPIRIPIPAIRGVIGNSDRYVTDLVDEVIGTLKIDEHQYAGHLAETPLEGAASATPAAPAGLYWQPIGSFNASAIRDSTAGAIVYRKPMPQLPNSGNADAVARIRARAEAGLRLQALAPAVGAATGVESSAANTGQLVNPSEATEAAQAREIRFRTGDAIDGIVERIDEQGITFRSSQTTTTFAPHAKIQHVWINRQRGTSELADDKLKRLMTVPRSMRQDPPTHLLVSVAGDFLRGRLIRLEGNQLTMEVRTEQVQLETAQVAQIIWLHDRDWSSAPEQPADAVAVRAAEGTATAPSTNDGVPPFLVHAIGRSDRGLTFAPLKLSEGILWGRSELLGECSMAVADMNQLLFGRNIGQQVREFQANPWILSLAQSPRVFSEEGAEASTVPGANSPLVGKPASDFLLRTLQGEPFRLSRQQGQVVVLDFWASWCGPCMQSMPQVDQVVGQVGGDKVLLVAVNIQETVPRVKAALERLKLSATTVLDIDGLAAAAYDASAIPQTVIINPQGTITHVFVGGGPKFVDQFRAALESVVGSKATE